MQGDPDDKENDDKSFSESFSFKEDSNKEYGSMVEAGHVGQQQRDSVDK